MQSTPTRCRKETYQCLGDEDNKKGPLPCQVTALVLYEESQSFIGFSETVPEGSFMHLGGHNLRVEADKERLQGECSGNVVDPFGNINNKIVVIRMSCNYCCYK